MFDCDAVVVGSGPNGLAAAVTLARAGLQVQVLEAEPTVGGGARTFHSDDAGPPHDLCSAVHPLAASSPFFRQFDLAARGVRFATPPVAYAHILSERSAAVAYRDLGRTAASLGPDSRAWTRLFGSLVAEHRTVLDAILLGRPIDPRLTRSLGSMARVLIQATPAWDLGWRTDSSRALLTGVAAHAGSRLPGAVGAGTLLMLGLTAHTVGWPIPIGGSSVITTALVDDLHRHGGSISTDCTVDALNQLPAARAYLFDTHPAVVAAAIGAPIEGGLRRRPPPSSLGVTKIDFELSGPVPWFDQRVAEAGTVHLGGARDELAGRERSVSAGGPGVGFIIASDPTRFDSSRIVAGRRPFWCYAHVATDSDEDVGPVVQAELDRAAPGFSDLVLRRRTIPAARLSRHNANYRGGDIAVGMHALPDFLLGTTRRVPPHSTPRRDVFVCSAATPPGPGVHGCCGYRAASMVLRRRFGITRLPDLRP